LPFFNVFESHGNHQLRASVILWFRLSWRW